MTSESEAKEVWIYHHYAYRIELSRYSCSLQMSRSVCMKYKSYNSSIPQLAQWGTQEKDNCTVPNGIKLACHLLGNGRNNLHVNAIQVTQWWDFRCPITSHHWTENYRDTDKQCRHLCFISL